MARDYIPVDVANTPDLKWLAELVRRTGKPHALTDGAETLAVVRPVPKRRAPSRSAHHANPYGGEQVSPTNDPALAQLIEDDLRANREAAVDRDALLAPPSPEVLEQRKAIYDQIQVRRHRRVIAPLTAADLIHLARSEEEEAYGAGC